MGQQILDIKHSLDIILGVGIYGDSGVIVFQNTFHDIRERGLHIEVHHVDTRCHHLAGHLIAKTDDSLEHVLFFGDFLLVGQLQSLLQLVDRKCMTFFLHYLGGNFLGTHQCR